MAIKTINSVFSKDNGSTSKVVCPVCSKEVSLRLFENIDSSPLVLLLGKEGDTDFAVCPECASVFALSENYIKEYKNGTTCYVTPDDLTLIEKA